MKTTSTTAARLFHRAGYTYSYSLCRCSISVLVLVSTLSQKHFPGRAFDVEAVDDNVTADIRRPVTHRRYYVI